MARDEALIETGVDKLVSLINARKKITLKDAAKELHVSVAVIEEWADFLEEEGVISLDYTLSTTYLMPRQLSQKEIAKKSKEFHISKDAFVRKIETSLSKLEDESVGFNILKDKFTSLKDQMAQDIVGINDDLRELQKLEQIKTKLEDEMKTQQHDFNTRIHEMDLKLMEEKNKYGEVLKFLRDEETRLKDEGHNLEELRKKEAIMISKMDMFKKAISDVRDSIEDEKGSVDVTEKKIRRLELLIEKIEERIANDKDKLDQALGESKVHEKKILEVQDRIVKKVAEKKSDIEKNITEGRRIASDFNEFFKEKGRIETMIKTLDKELEDIRSQLNTLVTKANVFSLAAKTSDVKNHINDLEKKYREIECKRTEFRQQMTDIFKILKV